MAPKFTENSQLTAWVKRMLENHPENVITRKRHIERERIWRRIFEADVLQVLRSGQCVLIRSTDESVIWRGEDQDGRCLELLCSVRSVEGRETLLIEEAHIFLVGTAYEPGTDDEVMIEEWLRENPDYERTLDKKGVQRKLTRFQG